MWRKGADFRPVLPSQVPEEFRRVIALSDLSNIAAQSQEQAAVHTYALRAAASVVRASAGIEVLHEDRLEALVEQFEEPPDEPDRQLTVGKVAQEIVSPTRKPSVGVAKKDIVRDVLTALHPDRAPAGVTQNDERTKTFQAITAAQKQEDNMLAQTLYANTVASSVETQQSASALEKARYKAWVGLQAGKGRFATQEDVDAWKTREIASLPLRKRAGMLMSMSSLFARALGSDAEGAVVLPSAYHYPIASGLEASGEIIKEVMSGSATPADVAYADVPAFDRKMGPILARLEQLLQTQRGMWGTGSYVNWQLACEFASELAAAARDLQPNKRQITALSLARTALRNTRQPFQRPGKEGHYFSE